MSGSFLKLLWPVIGENFARMGGSTRPEPAPARKMFRRLPADWEAPARPLLPWLYRRIACRSRQPRRWRSNGWATGCVIPAPSYTGCYRRSRAKAWRSGAKPRFAFAAICIVARWRILAPPDGLREAGERVEAGLIKTLRDPRGRWILEPHREAECEAREAGFVDGQLVEATIDQTSSMSRTCAGSSTTKAARTKAAIWKRFSTTKKLVTRNNWSATRDCCSSGTGRIRLGLYFPLLGGWREWPAAVVRHQQASLFEL